MKVAFTCLSIVFCMGAVAQTNCYTSAKAAYDSYNEDGLYSTLKQAEEYAKTCSGDPAYKDNLKFWLLRASISMDMFEYNYATAYKVTEASSTASKEDNTYASVYAGDLDSVNLALFNAETLDKDRELAESFKIKFTKLYDKAYKVGLCTYNAGDYKYASKYLQLAARACYRANFSYNKDVVTYAALATYQNADWKEAAEYYHIMALNEWGGKSLPIDRAFVQFKAGYYPAALTTIEKGLQDSPDNIDLLLTRAKVLDKQGKTADAISELDVKTKRDASNVNLWYAQAKFLDYLANPYSDKNVALPKPANYLELVNRAEMAYKNATLTGTKDFYWYYNAAILCNNACAYCYEKGKAGDNTMQAAFTKYQLTSLGYFEKAYAINPKHKTTVQALAYIYRATGNTVLADKMDSEFKLLK